MGTDGPDELSGNAGDNVIRAGAGADTVRGLAGADLIYGGLGNDVIFGDDGDDTLFGGFGADTIFAGSGDDLVYGGEGDDLLISTNGSAEIHGDAGNDEIILNAALYGPPFGASVAYGGEGDDLIRVESGQNDTVFGGAGADTIWAFSGEIFGGEGDDRLTSLGAARLTGGDGVNIFGVIQEQQFQTATYVADYVDGVDAIEIDVGLFGNASDFNVIFNSSENSVELRIGSHTFMVLENTQTYTTALTRVSGADGSLAGADLPQATATL